MPFLKALYKRMPGRHAARADCGHLYAGRSDEHRLTVPFFGAWSLSDRRERGFQPW